MGAEAFIATCNRLRALDFSPASARRALYLVEEEMPLRYAMLMDPKIRRTTNQPHFTARNRRGQWHELVQHLTDLAYLTPAWFQRWHLWRESNATELPSELLGTVLTAVGAFVAEDDYPTFREVGEYPPSDRAAQLDWTERLLPVLVYRTSIYTSFDAEFLPRPHYHIGEKSAYGRSLAFRIRVYFHDYVDRRTDARKAYFDHDLVPYLYSLDNSLGDRYRRLLPNKGDEHIHADVQELLLDAELLFKRFREFNRFLPDSSRPYFLAYQVDPPLDLPLDLERDGKRMERLSRRAGRKLQRDALHRDTGNNRLGVRLLQLSLWRAGFYTGALDGVFGQLSHRAVLALVEQERETGTVLKDRQLDRVCLPAGDGDEGLWLIDLRLVAMLLDAYMPGEEADIRHEEDQIWERIKEEGLEDKFDDQLVSRQNELRSPYGNQSLHPDRRVYYGIRGLIRGAFRGIGRIVRWVAGVVREILGAVFDFVKAVVKRIQEGIGMFLEGFRYFAHYLLGRPFVSLGEAVGGRHPVILTRFALDFDAISFVDESVTGADRRAHVAYLQQMSDSVTYFIHTTVGIIRLVSGFSSSTGWLRLGIFVARWVRDRLRSPATA